jgi:hypothetical protein
MADFSFTIEQKEHFHANFKTTAGRPGRVDGIPVWTASDPTDGTAAATGVVLTPDADGLGCVAIADGEGEFDLTVDGDADLGEGVRDVIKTVRVAVMGAEATGVDVTADAPEVR